MLAVTSAESEHAFSVETSEGLAERLRHRRDDLDPRGGAALRGPAAPGDARADPRRRPALPLAHHVRAPGLPAPKGPSSPCAAAPSSPPWAASPPRRRQPAPARGAGPSPRCARTRLPERLHVLVRENPTAPVVAMSLLTRMGTRWETPADAGISNLLQLMVVRGTQRLDGGQIVEAADRMGGSIDAYGDVDYAEIRRHRAVAPLAVEMLGSRRRRRAHADHPDGHRRRRARLPPQPDPQPTATSPTTSRSDTLLARLYGVQPLCLERHRTARERGAHGSRHPHRRSTAASTCRARWSSR